MSHSTHVGFRLPPATAFSGKLFRWCWLGPPLLLASCTVGVGNIAAIVASDRPPPGLLLSRPVIFAKSGPPADAFGVGHLCGVLTICVRLTPVIASVIVPPLCPSVALGVAHNPHSLTSVRRTNG
jgi:hypothetical protein